ncbi:OB-fold-containig protein [Kalamiella sp. sgz302252]|uniref:OB-fold-containig protein n=1 Tax=Pantoea sp. sgz302252 TaxID=3341827 RepID=UPI0036D3B1C4
MNLFSPYNGPYLFALSFVLLILVLEVIALIFGQLLSGALDAHLEDYETLSNGNVGQILHYLNIGRLPALAALCLLAGYFGIFGLLAQQGWVSFWQVPLSNLLLVPLTLIFSVIAAHYTGKAIAPWLPHDETSAINEKDYIGCMAVVTGHAGRAGLPCEAKFTDKFGQTHYLLLEPEEGKEFHQGDRVLIICRLSATRYLAELNPWPDVL